MNDIVDNFIEKIKEDGENFGRFASLRKAVSPNKFDEVLLNIQDSHNSILPIVFFELSRNHELDYLLNRYELQISAFVNSNNYTVIKKIWKAFTRLMPLAADVRPSHWKIRLFLALELREFNYVLIDENIQASKQYCLRSLRKIHDFFTKSELPKRAQHINSIEHFDETRKHKALEIEQASWFQNEIISSGVFELYEIDRFKKVRCCDSVFVGGATLYLFPSKKPYVILMGGHSETPLCLIQPSSKTIFYLNRGRRPGLTAARPSANLAHYLFRTITFEKQYNALTGSLESRKTNLPPSKITLKINGVPNFANHVRNFYSGLQRAIEYGDIAHVDTYSFTGLPFFGELHDIFPELKPLSWLKTIDGKGVDPSPFDFTRLVVPLGGAITSESLVSRVRKNCNRLVSDIPSESRVLESIKDSAINIWFCIRVADKSWLEQDVGIAQIISSLHADYPQANFIIDGFSLPHGNTMVMERWKGAFESISRISQNIIKASPPTAKIIDLVGLSLPLAIAAAQYTNLYVSPIGTSHHKIAWFSSAEGLIYLPQSASGKSVYAFQGTWDSEISRLPDMMFATSDHAGQRFGNNDRRNIIDNMSLDPFEIENWLRSKLDILQPSQYP